MHREQAQKIVDWISKEPKTINDYHASYTIKQIVDACNYIGTKPPSWVTQYLEDKKKWDGVSLITRKLAKGAAEHRKKMIMETFRGSNAN